MGDAFEFRSLNNGLTGEKRSARIIKTISIHFDAMIRDSNNQEIKQKVAG